MRTSAVSAAKWLDESGQTQPLLMPSPGAALAAPFPVQFTALEEMVAAAYRA